MTVTPIHNRPGARHRPRATHAPVWTLTFDVQVTGEADPAVLELIRELSRVADRSLPRPRRVLMIDPRARSVRRGETAIELSRLEFDLLLYLARNPGRAFTREHLLTHIWGDVSTGTRTVDVHIRRLRVKAGDGPLITTVRSIGYRLADGIQLEIVPNRAR